MRTALTAVAFQYRLDAALGVEARRDRTGLAAAKRIRRIRQPGETEQVSSPQSESEGFASQLELELEMIFRRCCWISRVIRVKPFWRFLPPAVSKTPSNP